MVVVPSAHVARRHFSSEQGGEASRSQVGSVSMAASVAGVVEESTTVDASVGTSCEGRSSFSLEADRAALERQQFQLYFQPQVLAVEGFPICGAEALIRWVHPERGMVPPGEFIPVIEESRLIIDVGDWVLAEAMRHARVWREQGRPISISVNVSALQVRQNNFVAKLADIARAHADVVPLIRLEVTEGLMLDDQEKALAKLQAVKALGFELALDDFGTGYSSLAYLAHYPFDELKIDRAFVSGLGIDRAASSIVEAIILLSRALGLQVVAEGVETQSQSEILRKLGCPRIQGYLYGRPMSAQDFTQRLFA